MEILGVLLKKDANKNTYSQSIVKQLFFKNIPDN